MVVVVVAKIQGSISPTWLYATFTCADPKRAKRLSSHQCIFALLESARVKNARKMMVKLTPRAERDLNVGHVGLIEKVKKIL